MEEGEIAPTPQNVEIFHMGSPQQIISQISQSSTITTITQHYHHPLPSSQISQQNGKISSSSSFQQNNNNNNNDAAVFLAQYQPYDNDDDYVLEGGWI